MKELTSAIESAYCWEGGATAKLVNSAPAQLLEFEVSGSSTVEHSGDVSGICEQVRDLRGTVFVDGEVTYTVQSATVTTRSGERHSDGEYTVYVNGKVVVKVS